MSNYDLPANLNPETKRKLEAKFDELASAARRAVLEGVVGGDGGFKSMQGVLGRMPASRQTEARQKANAVFGHEGPRLARFKPRGASRPIGGSPAGGGGSTSRPSAAVAPPPATWHGPRYVALRLDYIECLKDTTELDKDEITIGGIWFDCGAAQEGQVPPQYLGKFKKGDARSSDRTIWRVRLNDAKTYPTRAKAVLFLAEKDLSGGFVDVLTEIHERAKEELEDYLTDLDIGGDGGSNPDWWKIVIEGILVVIEAVFGALVQLFADDIFTTPIVIASPAIVKASNAAETWGGDNRSSTQKFTVSGWGGKYELGLYWRREN